MSSESKNEMKRQKPEPGTAGPAICYITAKGSTLAERLKTLYPHAHIVRFDPGKIIDFWKCRESLVFIMAAGIVVRTLAPLVKDKKTDPAVIVLDENGRHAVSLLSGHLGGANDQARQIAAFLGGEAVITTASDLNGITSIDVWARDQGLGIEDWELLPRVGTRLLNEGTLDIFADIDLVLPPEFIRVEDPAAADILITNRTAVHTVRVDHRKGTQRRKPLYLRPKNLVLGIGCNRNTSAEEIEEAVRMVLERFGYSFLSAGSVATIDIKAKESGLLEFCEQHGLTVDAFMPDDLNRVAGITESAAALRATGARAVSEPAALLASGADKLLIGKQKSGNVTVAVAQRKSENEGGRVKQAGKIYVVGTGPGGMAHITPAAREAISESESIVGYGTYLGQIKDLLGGKDVVSTGMTQEIDRCRKAIDLALSGRTVSVISGGDPGIYAMAGLVFELLRNQETGDRGRKGDGTKSGSHRAPWPRIPVEVIPGISALNACAARLGAPLMHDFASVSLSDRLTPWETIEKRLEAAAMADFVVVLYNPKSKGRTEHIHRAREIVMKYRGPDTPVGIVRAAMRENEVIVVTDLEHMLEHEIDMQTSVLIGNSNTLVWNNLMITPRGYEKKKQYHSEGSRHQAD